MKPICSGNVSRAGLPVALLLAGYLGLGLGNSAKAENSSSEQWRFAVISDPHLYNARLGTSGSAYERYLLGDPKMLKESEAILEASLARVAELDVRFLLVAGDLTREGELVNHVLMAQHLHKLEKKGVKVFVIPGNHDINNPRASRYRGDEVHRVAKTTPVAFQSIYRSFGYGDAIARDPSSLSYLAEPVPGIWLLGIDACKYEENLASGSPIVGGRISAPTMSWILSILQEAQARGKEVIAFMHHGIASHFPAEPVLFPDYLVDNWEDASDTLAENGLKVVFTGHYHSQDAAFNFGTAPLKENLCDVETGSLAQYPCAFRVVTVLRTGWLRVHSERIENIPGYDGDVPFPEYADAFLRVHMQPQVVQELMVLLGLSEAEAIHYAPLAIDALVANYAGDEAPSPETQLQIWELLSSPDARLQQLGMLLGGIWTDMPPASDNDLCVPYMRGVAGNDPGRPSP